MDAYQSFFVASLPEIHFGQGKVGEIGEGTSEIQRLVISRLLLKEAEKSDSMFGFPEGWKAE